MRNARLKLTACMIALLAAGCGSPRPIEPAQPKSVSESRPAKVFSSQVRVPVAVSIETLRQFAESSVPPNISGSKGLGNFGPTSGNSLSWNLNRTPLSVIGGGNRLSVTGSIGGSVRVAGSIKPIRGDIGKILGKANPSQPYSQSANVGADISASIAPELRPDWSIDPHLAAQAIVREASARIVGVFDISFRGELQGPVNDAVNNAVADLTSRIMSDRTLKTKGVEAWNRLCEGLPVKTGEGSPDLSLRITPQGFRATQPSIDAEAVRIELGLDAIVRLVAASEPVEPCPPFNETLAVEGTGDGQSLINVAAVLRYDDINQILEALRKANPVITDNGVKAEIRRVVLSPLGDRLLLQVDGVFSETKWFGASAEGTIFLTAKPKLDAASQVITFSDVSMDAESKSALGKVAAALADGAAPLIEGKISEARIDLKPVAEKARADANAAAEAIKSATGPIKVIDATVERLSLREVWHDEAGLHVTAAAEAKVAVEAVSLNP